MLMTIVNVCKYVYAGQVEAGNIKFGSTGVGDIFITYWNVAGQEQPTIEALQALIPTYQSQFDFDSFVTIGTPLIAKFVDSVAQQKNYNDAVSCASYINSTITQWKNEATAFIAWRDSVYNYCIAQETAMQNGLRSVPTFETFQAELPVITWP